MLKRALLFVCLTLAPWAATTAEAGSWVTHGPVPDPPLAGVISYSLTIEPGANHNYVYAGTTDSAYRSADGGLTWVSVRNGLPTRFSMPPPNAATVLAIAADPQGLPGGPILFAGTDIGPDLSGLGPQLFRSTDRGDSWQPVLGMPHAFSGIVAIAFDPTPVADPATQRTVYVATIGSGVWKSTDGGQTFASANVGLPSLGMMHSIAVAPTNTNVLYAGVTTGGMWKSTDAGASWFQASHGFPAGDCFGCPYHTPRGLAIDPNDAGVVYAATSGAGVWKTTDGGASWFAVNNGIIPPGPASGFYDFTAVAIDPATTSTVYATSTSSGVHRSLDGGGSWTTFNDGLTNTTIQSFLIDPVDPALLYAGSSGNGVFIRDESAGATADLSITKSASPASVTVGQTITYTLVVINAGPDTATNVQVVDVLPSAVSFASVASTSGTCVNTSGTVTCTIPSIPVNGGVSISITVTADVAGAFGNTAGVSATEDDPNPTNDSSTASVVVNAPPPQPQTITFTALPTKTFGDPAFTVVATASSGLPVTFSASGDCAVSGNVVTITAAGSCSITASQGGNGSYQPATPVIQTFTINKGDQTITFAPLANKTVGDPPFTVSATASSGLPVSFSAAGNCSISGNTVTLGGVGSCSVTASQGGNANYNPAAPVTQSFTITPGSTPPAFGFLGFHRPYGRPADVAFKVGQTIPLKWQYTNGGAVVPSPSAAPTIKVNGVSCAGGAEGAGISAAGTYQYDSATSTWHFNWKTGGLAAGCYNIRVHSGQTGQTDGPLPIKLR